MSSPWPSFDAPPAVAFIDVDGTLLAYVTPGLTEAVQVWTAGLMAAAGQAS